MKKYVTFYGGFHNCPEIRVRVDEYQYNALKEGFVSVRDILTKSQQKRLDRHFCGLSQCMCGGLIRAKMKF